MWFIAAWSFIKNWLPAILLVAAIGLVFTLNYQNKKLHEELVAKDQLIAQSVMVIDGYKQEIDYLNHYNEELSKTLDKYKRLESAAYDRHQQVRSHLSNTTGDSCLDTRLPADVIGLFHKPHDTPTPGGGS